MSCEATIAGEESVMPRKMDESAPNHKAGMLVLTRRSQESVYIVVPDAADAGET